jgi:hypothetical protein
MKTKTSILTLIKAFFILLVSGSVLSCNLEVKKEEKVAETETKKEEVLVEKTEATKQEETPKKKGKTAKAE